MRREEGRRAQEGWKDTICDPYAFAHRASECSTFAMLISPYLQRTGVLNSIRQVWGIRMQSTGHFCHMFPSPALVETRPSNL